jgi:hypothetical protein
MPRGWPPPTSMTYILFQRVRPIYRSCGKGGSKNRYRVLLGSANYCRSRAEHSIGIMQVRLRRPAKRVGPGIEVRDTFQSGEF